MKKKAPDCKRCGNMRRELVVPVDGKQEYSVNCPACNRNGRRPWIYPGERIKK